METTTSTRELPQQIKISTTTVTQNQPAEIRISTMTISTSIMQTPSSTVSTVTKTVMQNQGNSVGTSPGRTIGGMSWIFLIFLAIAIPIAWLPVGAEIKDLKARKLSTQKE